MTYFFLWFCFSMAVGALASSKGRAGLGWFVLALLISPLLAGIFCLLVKDLGSPAQLAPAGPTSATHVKCPACAEFVLPEATICKHCHSAIAPQTDFHQKRYQEFQEQTALNNRYFMMLAGAAGVCLLGYFLFGRP